MNLTELAKKLDVSASTISRVLNDKPGISQATRDKVLAAVKAEGFSLNCSARNLAKSETNFIGVIARKRGLAQDEALFHHSLAQFQEIFLKNNFIVIPLSYRDKKVDFASTPLSPSDFAGFIIRGQSIPSRVILSIQQYQVPYILLENDLQEIKVNTVICNDMEAEYELVSHLIKKGCRRIIHVTGPADWYNDRQRLIGYQKAMAEAKLPEEVYNEPDTTLQNGADCFLRIKLKKNEKTGIAFVNDAMALGYIDAAMRGGYVIPDDVSVTGFDDIPWAKLTKPALTTSQICIEQMCRLTARRLLDMINNPEEEPVKMIVPCCLKVRETT
ncbi:MAG: LacI family transcriptional regulator [Spirochaetia bacterium]|jgi:LacI family transcriptional regulator|nr:LacI family transcriptional regulator [Spirochaetia bacterium]